MNAQPAPNRLKILKKPTLHPMAQVGFLVVRRKAQAQRSNTAMLSTWAVCGNMFTTPAATQR